MVFIFTPNYNLGIFVVKKLKLRPLFGDNACIFNNMDIPFCDCLDTYRWLMIAACVKNVVYVPNTRYKENKIYNLFHDQSVNTSRLLPRTAKLERKIVGKTRQTM